VRVDQQIGLEATPQAHICVLLEVFAEVWRVLRDDGTLWLNLGDSYAAARGGTSMPAETLAGGVHGKGDGAAMRGRGEEYNPRRNAHRIGLKHKDLMMMPSRVAIALQDAGWYVRSEIVWHKRAPMPESVTDRPTCAHEKIFLMTKRERYYYDAEAVREPVSELELLRKRSPRNENYSGWDAGIYHSNPNMPSHYLPMQTNPAGRSMRNVWTLSPSSYPEAHFATFPPELPKRCILAGTSEKGCCPKCGKGWRRIVTKAVAIQGKPNTNIGGGFDHDWEGTPRANVQVETVGWQPSCSCEDVTEEHLLPAVVLDPFMGAGTSALVAKTLGRRSIGIELNPAYIELCRKRLAQGCLELR
jgi:DNA modification methylase